MTANTADIAVTPITMNKAVRPALSLVEYTARNFPQLICAIVDFDGGSLILYVA